MKYTYSIWAAVFTACATGSGAVAAPAPGAAGAYYYDEGIKHGVALVPGLIAEVDAQGPSAVKGALPSAEVMHTAGTAIIYKAAPVEVDQALRSPKFAKVKVSAVYREGTSAAGRLMALPGGALVNFKPEWTEAQINTWVVERGYSLTQKLNLPGNWYLVGTPAGEASLKAANAIQESGAVLSASPNWWKQTSAR